MYKGYNTYKERNAILLAMGFQSYNDYLQSDLWAGIKCRALSQFGRTCSICKTNTNLIHHRNYTKENLTGQSLEWLVPICGDCHKEIEFNYKGRKRSTLDQVDRAYLGLCKGVKPKAPVDQKRLEKKKKKRKAAKRMLGKQSSENHSVGKFLRENYPEQFKMVLQKMNPQVYGKYENNRFSKTL